MVQLLAAPTPQNGTAAIALDTGADAAPGVVVPIAVANRLLMAAATLTAARPEQNGSSSPVHSSKLMLSREEHAQLMAQMRLKRGNGNGNGAIRLPRRAWSTTEEPAVSATVTISPSATAPPTATVTLTATTPATPGAPTSTSAITLEPAPSPPCSDDTPDDARPSRSALPRRPILPRPRRSYSVMDYEPPARNTHRASAKLTISDLPAELHYAIFDFLDPIDSTCLGLVSHHFHSIHKRMHPTPIPLSTRRSGPNDLEWAWRLAGPLLSPATAGLALAAAAASTSSSSSSSSPSSGGSTTTNVLGGQETTTAAALERLRVKGHVYCRKCGVARCELHRHLREWMGEGQEYCSVKQKFGPAAGEGAREYCFMSSPKRPHRCGRHGGKPKA